MRIKMKHGGLPTQQTGTLQSHGRPHKDFTSQNEHTFLPSCFSGLGFIM